MEKVVATIVIIVLTMGLISYAIIGQLSGFKDTADVITQEGERLNMILKDSSVVTKNTALKYFKKGIIEDYDVMINNVIINDEKELEKYDENILFTMTKDYDDYGKISSINFTIKEQYYS